MVLLGALVVAVAVVALTRGGPSQRSPLDPDNPDPSGAQALARVLDDQGVDVTVVRDADSLERTAVDDDTTVVVTSSRLLGRSTIERLREHTADATLVVVDPGPGTTRALGVDAPPSRVRLDAARPGDCVDPTYDDLEVLVDSGLAYDVPGACFGGLLVQPRDDLLLLGAGQALSNDQVVRADNAAMALRLLGQDDRLVWYVPDAADLVAGDGVSATTLLPLWLRPALLLGLLATIALLLWRVRRLGALSTEPLPVVVKAIETTRSRGRLYRRSGDRSHAAEVLRGAARDRLATSLALGAHADPAALAREVAHRTGRAVDDVDALIGPHAPAPRSDQDLVTLASALAGLDREVRRP
jgi:hypothetical protein